MCRGFHGLDFPFMPKEAFLAHSAFLNLPSCGAERTKVIVTLKICQQSNIKKWSQTLTKKVLIAQSCPTLCDPIDCSQPGSSVDGISQARIVEWVAISFSRYLPNAGIEPGSPVLQAYSLPPKPPGKPFFLTKCFPKSPFAEPQKYPLPL